MRNARWLVLIAIVLVCGACGRATKQVENIAQVGGLGVASFDAAGQSPEDHCDHVLLPETIASSDTSLHQLALLSLVEFSDYQNSNVQASLNAVYEGFPVGLTATQFADRKTKVLQKINLAEVTTASHDYFRQGLTDHQTDNWLKCVVATNLGNKSETYSSVVITNEYDEGRRATLTVVLEAGSKSKNNLRIVAGSNDVQVWEVNQKKATNTYEFKKRPSDTFSFFVSRPQADQDVVFAFQTSPLANPVSLKWKKRVDYDLCSKDPSLPQCACRSNPTSPNCLAVCTHDVARNLTSLGAEIHAWNGPERPDRVIEMNSDYAGWNAGVGGEAINVELAIRLPFNATVQRVLLNVGRPIPWARVELKGRSGNSEEAAQLGARSGPWTDAPVVLDTNPKVSQNLSWLFVDSYFRDTFVTWKHIEVWGCPVPGK